MMRSMFSAISGLRNHQTFMDVVGNNIANINTTGFKQSRVTFQDILSQTTRGASGPQGGRGGTNPMQVGLGTLIAGVDTIQSQGTLQSTGKLTDLAIQGDGYFVMS
ncbi:MAG: flagellar hook-basal body complex protein, partial [Chloroflexota bacterium]|nr:flagellar hook-basal body complex protein [Chloroflexota bacterium]